MAELRTYHRNPRQGDVAAIRQSLRVHGQYKPVVVNRGTYTGRPSEVLAGNHTVLAAREEGWTTLWVGWVDVDDDQAARIVLVDNRTADRAEYDDRLLAELLADLPDLDGTGYDPGDLDKLIKDVLPEPGDAEPGDLQQSFGVVVECRDETQQAELLERLAGEGWPVRALMR
ncbi:MAG TPA: ParB/RepB/Spo0J family partition protein [Pseudonocardiaceae bacterium]|nr:ParB/RepB/Spo0J family partition protein [Pseudonocardiaceae bacterium]